MNRVTWMVVIFLGPICCCLGAALQEDLSDFLVQAPGVERQTDFIILAPAATFTPTPGEEAISDRTGDGDDEEFDDDREGTSERNDDDDPTGDASSFVPPSGPTLAATETPTALPTQPPTPTPTALPTLPALPTPTPTAIPPPPTVEPTSASNPAPISTPPGPPSPTPTADDQDPPPQPTATATFTPTPQPPVVAFDAAGYSVAEAAGAAVITVTLTGPLAAPVTVDYASADRTATMNSDYQTVTGTLTFLPGQSAQSFMVPITDDLFIEADEIVALTLIDPSPLLQLGLPISAALTIISDDGLIVNATDDLDDGACSEVHCTLREAIKTANANPGQNTITFTISGQGPHTISPASPLPIIADPVAIDGRTQPGTDCQVWPPILRIVLNGVQAGANTAGLVITAGDSTVRGLAINRFGGAGIELNGQGNNIVACNFIGTDVAGAATRGNGGDGVRIASGQNNTITENVISGNGANGVSMLAGTMGVRVQGNYIGTDVSGAAALGNTENGIMLADSAKNMIGETISGAGNRIAYNGRDGIFVDRNSQANSIQANAIFNNGELGIDLSNDLDLAVGNSNAVNQLYRNDGNRQFTELLQALGSDAEITTSVAWGDIDGDGDLDLAVGNVAQVNQLYRNDGNGQFTELPLALGSDINPTESLAWGDMDGDGDLDLAVGNAGGVNQIYRNNGSGQFTELSQALGSNATTTFYIEWGDIDGDGDLDLAVGNDGINQVHRNDGSDQFTELPLALGSDTNLTTSLAWGDIDGDGDLDLAVGNNGQANQLYRNDGGGQFTELLQALGSSTDHTDSLAWGDLDGDGDLDLAVGNGASFQNEANQLYQNDGKGQFTDLPQAFGADTKITLNVAWGDIDGDSDLDLAVGNDGGQINQVYWNDGNGQFTELAQALGSNTARTLSLAWGDMDGDGGNRSQSAPILRNVASGGGGDVIITGALNSVANTTFRLEFFAGSACDPAGGEGEIFLGTRDVATGAGGGSGLFTVTLPAATPGGRFITATATDPNGNTSAFSPCCIAP